MIDQTILQRRDGPSTLQRGIEGRERLNRTHRSVPEILHSARQLNRFAGQTGDVGRQRDVEIRSDFRRRVRDVVVVRHVDVRTVRDAP